MLSEFAQLLQTLNCPLRGTVVFSIQLILSLAGEIHCIHLYTTFNMFLSKLNNHRSFFEKISTCLVHPQPSGKKTKTWLNNGAFAFAVGFNSVELTWVDYGHLGKSFKSQSWEFLSKGIRKQTSSSGMLCKSMVRGCFLWKWFACGGQNHLHPCWFTRGYTRWVRNNTSEIQQSKRIRVWFSLIKKNVYLTANLAISSV